MAPRSAPATAPPARSAARFAVPSPPRVMIERPRLREAVLAGLERPATLVCGPAGSGKTALVASAVGAPRVAWIGLEPADDDPERLWSALAAALAATGAAPALPEPPAAAHDTFMPVLVNAFAALPAPVVVVLDDVGVLRSRACLTQLAFLLAHIPDTLRLVLIARADPPLPLHVLRVRNRLAEIRPVDLAFTEAEAAQLFSAHGLVLPEAVVHSLHARTEGWAAGLRLAALGLTGHDDPERFTAEFGGDDRGVAGYLLAEVLDHEPPRVRAFLLRTSLVRRIRGELADALTGDDRGTDTLARLEAANGFVQAAGDGWFRYHAMFATLLRARAARELPGELPALHARAARWYARHGDAVEALRHAVAAEDWDVAVAAVAGRWLDVFVGGEAATVRELLRALPEERAARDAELAAGLACAALEAGDGDAADAQLARAGPAAAALPAARLPRYGETVALGRLLRARHECDLGGALDAAGALLAADSDEPRRALVHALLGETALWAHRFERAGDELRRAIALARLNRLDHVSVCALAHLALLDVMTGGPAGDRRPAREAIELAHEHGWEARPHLAAAHLALAAAEFYDLAPDRATEHLGRARSAAARAPRRPLECAIAHLDARMHGAAGAVREGLRTLDQFGARHGAGAPAPFERPLIAALRARLLLQVGEREAAAAALAPAAAEPWLVVHVVAAQLALARGDPAGAVATLTAARRPPAHAVTGVEHAVLLAVAHDAAGDAAAAEDALERALELAELSRHRWPFLELGPPVEALLRRRIRAGTAHRAFAGELLDAFADRAPDAAAQPLLDPLSEREQAILRYLPTTLSNRDIAAELSVTTNTVKTHLRSIYRKLDVARRRDAVERARELRLLRG